MSKVVLDTMTEAMRKQQRDGEALFRAFFAVGLMTLNAVRMPHGKAAT